MSNDRDQTWVEMHDKKALDLMQGWTGGQSDPLYAISSTGGKNYAWVFEDAITNIDMDLSKVKKSGKKFKLGKGTFTKAEIDELRYIRDALTTALEAASGEGDLDGFTYAYFETALWSSTDESDPETGGEPLDANYGIGDFAPEARKDMITDAKDFQKRYGHLIESAEPKTVDYDKWERAGHDFWLTRNGHGAGFWDGDWPEPQATELTNAAHKYGECDLYVGDDGLIYTYGCGRPPRGAAEDPRQRYPEPPRGPGRFVTPRGEQGRGRGRHRPPAPRRRAPAHEARGHVVADFNTLEDLVQHAVDQLGATHVLIAGPETRIYFPRGGQYPYEEARVWRKAGYWHAEGPHSRQGVSHLPRDAQPVERQRRRAAAEAPRHRRRGTPRPRPRRRRGR